MKKVIGLTGGIASGKSTVSSLLKSLGAAIIDADEISREIVQPGKPALEEIKAYFGEEYLFKDGTLNRKKLGDYVFRNGEALKQLNRITHPLIIEEIKRRINFHQKNNAAPAIIIDAALLIEMGMVPLVEEVWLVAVPQALQLERLMERENLEMGGAKNRIAAQLSLEEKRKFADRVIDNSGDVEDLEAQVLKIWQGLLQG